MIFIHIEDMHFFNQIKYVFDTVFYILGVEYRLVTSMYNVKPGPDDICIIYAGNMDDIERMSRTNVICIKQCNKLFGVDYLKESSIPESIGKYYIEHPVCGRTDIISIFNDSENLYIKKTEGDLRILYTNIDFVSDIFFMLSRYEEVVRGTPSDNDEYSRFPAGNSVSFKNGFIDRPIVNEDIELLWSWIDSFKLAYKRREWWGGNSFIACLTHDVDWVLNYGFRSPVKVLMTSASLLLRRLKPKEAFNYLFGHVKSKLNYESDPYWTFDSIMNLEWNYGSTSSFYFMSGGTTDFDNRYKIESKKVGKLIKHIGDCGFEVGYHGSFDSYKSLQIMLHEKHRLNKLVTSNEYGCRQHYLRFKVPYTWRIQERCNLLYDTTLGYADCDGFRCGICLPYKPYDILCNRVVDIWEIPMIAMDATLDSYLNLSSEEALNRLMHLMDVISNYKGVFTLLTHNTSFSTHKFPNWKQNYERILQRINSMNGIGMSGREVVRIWKKDWQA
jgi:hypothetical protein